MAKYAYIDKGGILHIVEKMTTAREYATGKVVETEHPADHGYPVVCGEEMIVYSEEDMRVEAKGAVLPPTAELAELYRECSIGRKQ